MTDALRFHALNTEFAPNSAFAHRQAGQAYLAAGDTTKAIASFERAITLAPNDQQTARLLETLKQKP